MGEPNANKTAVRIHAVVQVLIPKNEFTLHQMLVAWPWKRFLVTIKKGNYTYPNLLPAGWIPQKIHPALTDPSLDINRARIGLVAGQPASFDFVVSPLATHQLFGDKFLHHIARHAVENVKQGFVAKAGDATLERLDIGNVVARRQSEILLQGDTCSGGDKRGSEGRMKRSMGVWSAKGAI